MVVISDERAKRFGGQLPMEELDQTAFIDKSINKIIEFEEKIASLGPAREGYLDNNRLFLTSLQGGYLDHLARTILGEEHLKDINYEVNKQFVHYLIQKTGDQFRDSGIREPNHAINLAALMHKTFGNYDFSIASLFHDFIENQLCEPAKVAKDDEERIIGEKVATFRTDLETIVSQIREDRSYAGQQLNIYVGHICELVDKPWTKRPSHTYEEYVQGFRPVTGWKALDSSVNTIETRSHEYIPRLRFIEQSVKKALKQYGEILKGHGFKEGVKRLLYIARFRFDELKYFWKKPASLLAHNLAFGGVKWLNRHHKNNLLLDTLNQELDEQQFGAKREDDDLKKTYGLGKLLLRRSTEAKGSHLEHTETCHIYSKRVRSLYQKMVGLYDFLGGTAFRTPNGVYTRDYELWGRDKSNWTLINLNKFNQYAHLLNRGHILRRMQEAYDAFDRGETDTLDHFDKERATGVKLEMIEKLDLIMFGRANPYAEDSRIYRLIRKVMPSKIDTISGPRRIKMFYEAFLREYAPKYREAYGKYIPQEFFLK